MIFLKDDSTPDEFDVIADFSHGKFVKPRELWKPLLLLRLPGIITHGELVRPPNLTSQNPLKKHKAKRPVREEASESEHN